MPIALFVARLILAPPAIGFAAWVVLWRRRRPDQIPRFFAIKAAAWPLAIAIAALASALGSPAVALAGIALADVVAYIIVLRLWIERRPRPLSTEEAATEARRHVDTAEALADVAERGKR